MKKTFLIQVSLVVALGACTKPNAAVCHDDQCIDPAAPFCDVDGAIAGTPGRCIAVECAANAFETCRGDSALVCNASGDSYDLIECQAGCDATTGCRPFCTPNEALGCTADQLSTCSADGTHAVVETCALGCAASGSRCNGFEPSNGLGPALQAAASEADVILPPGARINTDQGAVQNSSGTAIPVRTMTIDQVSGAPMMVIIGRSFSMADVTVTGSRPLAIVASGTITVGGRFSARAVGSVRGPGSQNATTCIGGTEQQYSCSCGTDCSVGTGGGGNAQPGGSGGGRSAATANGGGALSGFSPLAGGCSGGDNLNRSGLLLIAAGGGGGGAVQLVSASKVALQDQGLIDVGGGGGQSTAGGGSGGMVVIEAPEVTTSGPAAGVVANGGAGGGCGTAGADGRTDGTAAPGAVCSNYFAGSGGTGARVPTSGCVIGVDNCQAVCPVNYGGGGGSVGRMRLATRNGTYGTSGNPILSVQLTAASLNVQ